MKNTKIFNLKALLLLIYGIGALLVVFSRNIVGLMSDLIPYCYFAKNGNPCPSCGGTRCFGAFFSGRFVEAFKLNQYFFFLFIYLGLLFILLHVAAFTKHRAPKALLCRMAGTRAIIVWAVIYAAYGVLRYFFVF